MTPLPSRLVLDCTVTVPWYLTDESNELTERLFDQLGRTTYIVPVLWRLEFISALRAAHRRGRIPRERLPAIYAQATALPLVQEPLALDVAEVANGCEAYGLTPYDYVYLAVARTHGVPLATFDRALIRACHAAGVPCLDAAGGGVAEAATEYLPERSVGRAKAVRRNR